MMVIPIFKWEYEVSVIFRSIKFDYAVRIKDKSMLNAMFFLIFSF